MILSSKETEERDKLTLGKEEIIRHLGRDALALSRSTDGAVSVVLADLVEKTIEPEGMHDGSQRPHYTEDQLKEIATAERLRYVTGGLRLATLFIDNNLDAELYGQGAAGIANVDPKLPMVTIPAWCIGAFMHELGHLLNPEVEHFGEGPGHQPVLTTKRWCVDKDGVNTMRREMGAIQELVAKGCNLAENGNPYKSLYTVMAQRSSPDDRGEYRPGPLFSPPELAFLDPENRKVIIAIGAAVLAGVFWVHRAKNQKLFVKHWSMYLLIPMALLVVVVPLRVGGLDALVFGTNPAWLYILMALFNVTMQEYFTFGLLQSYIGEKLSPLWTIGLTAILFYLAHAVLISSKFAPTHWLASLSIVALGLLFAFFRHKTGTFYLSLALHLAFFFVMVQ